MSSAAINDSYQAIQDRQKSPLPTPFLPFSFSISTENELSGVELAKRFLQQLQKTPLYAVGAPPKKLRMKKPITVNITQEGGLYIAENETLFLYGMGESLQDAIEDLSAHIVYFHQYYSTLDWSQITGEAIRLKKIYEDLFVEENDAIR